MSGKIQYESSLSNVSLAIAKCEHLQPEMQLHWPVTCPNCLSDDTQPIEKDGITYVCANCGDVFNSPTA